MKQIKIYEYNVDNFIKGRFATYSPNGVRRYLRKNLLGFALYWKIRKNLIITEADDWGE